MRLTVFFLILLGSSPALAADSAWLLCQGITSVFGQKHNLVINSFEHRNGSDSRRNDFVLIYGGNVLRGFVDNTEGGNLTLKEGSQSVFTGTIKVDYQKQVLTLKGALSIGEKTNLNAELPCKEMKNWSAQPAVEH